MTKMQKLFGGILVVLVVMGLAHYDALGFLMMGLMALPLMETIVDGKGESDPSPGPLGEGEKGEKGFDMEKELEGVELSDEKLTELYNVEDKKKWIDEYKTAQAASTGAGTGKGADKKDTPKDGDKSAQDKPKGAEAGAAPADTPAKDTPDGKTETLLAGKYKTPEELKEAVRNAGKVLKYSERVVETLLAKTSDVKELETLYTEMDAAISANAKAAAAPAAGAERATSTELTNEERKAVTLEIAQLTVNEVRRTKVAKMLEKAGYVLPEKFLQDEKVSNEFMENLYDVDPAHYYALDRVITSTYARVKAGVDGYVSSLEESRTENAATLEVEKKAIKDYAAQIKLPLTDEELTKFIDEALKSPAVYSQKNNVNFLNKGGLFDLFYLRNREAIVKHERLIEREEAMKQYEAAHTDMLKQTQNGGISGNRTAPRKKESQVKIPDEEAFARLSAEEQDELIKKT